MSAPAVSRRDFLAAGTMAGAGLVVPVFVPPRAMPGTTQQQGQTFAPNAFVRVGTDGVVTVVIGYSEMGQGILTAIPMLVAEELEVDPATVRFEQGPSAPEYNNPLFGLQATGGSTTVRAAWEPMRRAGAAAREMLAATAAERLGVERAALTVENGTVSHAASNRRVTYGQLAQAASRQTAAARDIALKPSSAWKVLGKRVRRLDAPMKVTGRAGFGIDVRLPGMLTAVVARSPRLGGRVESFSATRARAVPGVRHVVQIESGIAVVADGYWAAEKGRDALTIQWDESRVANVSSASIRARWEELARTGTGAVTVGHVGNPMDALSGAARRIDAVYETPYLAHACMEPMNCTAHVRRDGCDVWAPTQNQGMSRTLVAQMTGLPESAVQIHTTMLGGGFGRKFELDFVTEAVAIARQVPAPVRLVWSREDDIRSDQYRPAVFNVLAAGLDATGQPVAWTHRSVSSSIMSRVLPQFVRDGKDESAFEGAAEIFYAIPNIHVDWIRDEPGVPVGFWRSVGNSHTAFVKESFLDEIAAASRTDPLELRRRLLSASSAPSARRLLGALNLAAERAGWGAPLPAGRGRGLAVHESFGSFVAEVAEVSIQDGLPRVHRVVAAIDCGQIVNPLTIDAQLASAIVYGLSAALHGEITVDGGRVVQSNFHDYAPLRMNEMPVIEAHIVPSTEAPGGVGEPGTPPIAPAVTNALFALTGRRIRRLPIRAEDLRQG